MAKSIKESLVHTHKLVATGTFNLDNEEKILETEDFGDVKLNDLLKNFNGKYITLTIAEKDEEDVMPNFEED